MRIKIIIAMLAGFLITGCVKDEIILSDQQVSDPEYKKPKKLKPFTGLLTSFPSESADLDCDCGEIPPLFIYGEGNITHLGNVSSDGVSCAIPQPWGFEVDGCVSLVAANGDEIFTDVEPYDLVFDTECFCKAVGNTSATFIGGTGRFANATGHADIEVVLDLATFEFKVNLKGGIDY